MSPLPPSKNKAVLITGINGYIASNIGLLLLRSGYHVRGTSRNPTAGIYLQEGGFQGYEDRYTHYVVADITQPGTFDEAVKGVHAILHTASPVDFKLKRVDDFFGPAIQGNISILNSAKQHAGSQLEAFVLTSSNAAVADRWRLPADHTYDESDWNETGESIARQSQKDFEDGTGPFLPMVAYGASKSAAEKAMWAWRAEEKPSFAISAINPSVVTGPPVSWPKEPSGLNETLMPVWLIFSGEAKEVPTGIGGMSFVDVRDVSLLHQWCMEHPAESDGERYICTNGKGTPQAMADILRKAYPDREIVKGEPGKDYAEDYWWPKGEASMVARKAYKALGVQKFEINFDQSILETATAFEQRWPEYIKNRRV